MPNEHYYLSLERNADVKAVPGMLIYAFRALLLFTNYEDFSRDLLSRIDEADTRPRTVVGTRIGRPRPP
jgi:MFS superfamily sulfate permease-like transporter